MPERIVANGRDRVVSSPEYAAECEEIERSVREEFEGELGRVGLFRRLVLRARMKRELRRRLARLAPRDACYLLGR